MNKHHETTLKIKAVLERNKLLQQLGEDDAADLLQDIKEILHASYNRVGYAVYMGKHEVGIMSPEQWAEVCRDNEQDAKLCGEPYTAPVPKVVEFGTTMQMYDDQYLFEICYEKEA